MLSHLSSSSLFCYLLLPAHTAFDFFKKKKPPLNFKNAFVYCLVMKIEKHRENIIDMRCIQDSMKIALATATLILNTN